MHAGKKTPLLPYGILGLCCMKQDQWQRFRFFWLRTPNIQEMFLIYRPDCPAVYVQTHRAVFMMLVFKQSVNTPDKLIIFMPPPKKTPKLGDWKGFKITKK